MTCLTWSLTETVFSTPVTKIGKDCRFYSVTVPAGGIITGYINLKV